MFLLTAITYKQQKKGKLKVITLSFPHIKSISFSK